MSKFTAAIELLRKDGPIAFSAKISQYLYNRLRGYQIVHVNGRKVKFELERGAENDPIVEDLLSVLKESDVFYDIGAGTGGVTCLVKAHSPDTEVVAFEPYPPNVDGLKSNLRLNGFSVDIRQVALSNENGSVEFSVPQEEKPGLGTGNIHYTTDESYIETQSSRLDDLMRSENLSNPSVVKIDVEGAESLVLEGGRNTFSDPDCRTVYIEVHLPYDSQPRPSIHDFDVDISDLEEKINDLGFSKIELGARDHGNALFWKCIKK